MARHVECVGRTPAFGSTILTSAPRRSSPSPEAAPWVTGQLFRSTLPAFSIVSLTLLASRCIDQLPLRSSGVPSKPSATSLGDGSPLRVSVYPGSMLEPFREAHRADQPCSKRGSSRRMNTATGNILSQARSFYLPPDISEIRHLTDPLPAIHRCPDVSRDAATLARESDVRALKLLWIVLLLPTCTYCAPA